MELEFDEPNLLKIKKLILKSMFGFTRNKKATYINQLIKTLKLFLNI